MKWHQLARSSMYSSLYNKTMYASFQQIESRYSFRISRNDWFLYEGDDFNLATKIWSQVWHVHFAWWIKDQKRSVWWQSINGNLIEVHQVSSDRVPPNGEYTFLGLVTDYYGDKHPTPEAIVSPHITASRSYRIHAY